MKLQWRIKFHTGISATLEIANMALKYGDKLFFLRQDLLITIFSKLLRSETMWDILKSFPRKWKCNDKTNFSVASTKAQVQLNGVISSGRSIIFPLKFITYLHCDPYLKISCGNYGQFFLLKVMYDIFMNIKPFFSTVKFQALQPLKK